MSKFDTLYQSNFNRFQGGGYLTGDVIKFKEGWENDNWSQNAPAQVVEKIRELAGSDLVLRVSSVKSVRPAVNSSIDQAAGVDDFYLDITQETAPGYYNGNFITVPQTLVELNGAPDRPEIPDSFKRKDEVDMKPKQEETKEQEIGMSSSTTKQNLPDSNFTQPGATAAKSYTAKYL